MGVRRARKAHLLSLHRTRGFVSDYETANSTRQRSSSGLKMKNLAIYHPILQLPLWEIFAIQYTYTRPCQQLPWHLSRRLCCFSFIYLTFTAVSFVIVLVQLLGGVQNGCSPGLRDAALGRKYFEIQPSW